MYVAECLVVSEHRDVDLIGIAPHGDVDTDAGGKYPCGIDFLTAAPPKFPRSRGPATFDTGTFIMLFLSARLACQRNMLGAKAVGRYCMTRPYSCGPISD